MLDFTELGLDIKHKIKMYINSKTTMHGGKQTKPFTLSQSLSNSNTHPFNGPLSGPYASLHLAPDR